MEDPILPDSILFCDLSDRMIAIIHPIQTRRIHLFMSEEHLIREHSEDTVPRYEIPELRHTSAIHDIDLIFISDTWISRGPDAVPQDTTGARRMPWHREPMKDAASCDNPRRGAPHPSTRGSPNGRTHAQQCAYPHPEHIGVGRTTRGTETSKYPEERKSISRLPSSGERKGTDGQTVERAYPAGVPPTGLQGRASGGCRPRAQVRLGSGTAWEGRPQRVTAPYANPDRTARRGP